MKYSPEQYARVLRGLLEEEEKGPRATIRDFLSFVEKNGALPLLPDIEREFGLLSDREKGIREVTIRAPERLSETEMARKIHFRSRIKSERDVRLKGGLVVETGDLRVDNSCAMRLKRLKDVFTK